MRAARNTVIRPLKPGRRPRALRALRYGAALLILALLPAAFPASGPDWGHSWSIVAGLLPPLVVIGAGYVYLRNTAVGVVDGRLVSTDLLGRRSTVDLSRLEDVVARRGLLDVVVIRGRAGRLVLPRAAWDIDALDRLVDALDLPVRNEGMRLATRVPRRRPAG